MMGEVIIILLLFYTEGNIWQQEDELGVYPESRLTGFQMIWKDSSCHLY